MIQDLLWRCPLCAADDALRHEAKFLHPERVCCTACGADWRVRRIVGDNYYLKLVQPGGNPHACPPGTEYSITAWYDLMKKTVCLAPQPASAGVLDEAESLYLASGPAMGWAEPDEPASPPSQGTDRKLGEGRLFLTDRRLLWHPADGSLAGEPLSFRLSQVDGIHGIVNLGLLLVVGRRLFRFRFAGESPLKWITYAALLAPVVQAQCGHKIRTSHY